MTQNRTYKATINMLVSGGTQVATTVFSFIVRRIFVQILSSNYLGIGGLFTSILTILSLAELGIGNAMVYNLYKPLHDNDREKISYYMVLYKKSYRIIAAAVFIMGTALLPFVKKLVGQPEGVVESITVIYFLFLLNAVLSYLMAYKRSILIADQKNYIVNIISTGCHLSQLLIQLGLLYMTKDYLAYLCVQLVFTIMTNFIITVYVNKHYCFSYKSYNRIDDKYEKEVLFKNVRSLSISKIAGVTVNSADNIITTKLISLSAVGLASNYTLVTTYICNLISNAISGLTGSIGNLNAEDNVENKRKVFDELFIATYMIYFIVCSCIYTLINPLICLWLGENYLLSTPVVMALVLTIYIRGMNYTAYSFRTTSGHFKEATKFYVASAVVNIVLSIALGKAFGLAGIYAATSIALLSTSEISDGYYGVKYGAQGNPRKYFLKYYFFLFIFVINSILLRRIISFIKLDGFMGLVIKGIVSVAICSSICILIVFRNTGFINLRKRLLKR